MNKFIFETLIKFHQFVKVHSINKIFQITYIFALKKSNSKSCTIKGVARESVCDNPKSNIDNPTQNQMCSGQ